MFELINGLPVHPLVVHAAVVFVPLTLLGTLIIAVKRSWRKALGWWVVLLAFVTVGMAFVAKESGEALAALIGLPEKHAELGDTLPVLAGVMFLATTALVIADRVTDRGRDNKSSVEGVEAGTGDLGAVAAPRNKQSPVVTVFAVLAVLVALMATFQTYRVGESGAKAVWDGRIQAATQPVAPIPTATASPSAAASSSPSASATGTASSSSSASASRSGSASGSPSSTTRSYTLAQVKEHGSAGDCWAAINGKVYDLTSWENKHPGGAQRIIALCGTDGTAAFLKQHGDKSKPNEALDGFQIGVLALP